MDSKYVPNFFIIGAQKSGTSSLHAMLKQHPDIFMSEIKELEFFNHSNRVNEEFFHRDYLKHFQDANGQAIIGESTASYIWTYSPDSPWCNQSKVYNRQIPRSIKDYLGDNVQFLVILRDPVQRAVSAYMHHFRNGRIRGKNADIKSVGKKFGIIDIGFYARHLKEWLLWYPADSFCIFRYEELFEDLDPHIKRLCSFLNIQGEDLKPHRRNTSSGIVHCDDGITLSEDELERVRTSFMEEDKPHIAKQLNQPLITWDQVAWLKELYRPDVTELQKLLNWDLSKWQSLQV